MSSSEETEDLSRNWAPAISLRYNRRNSSSNNCNTKTNSNISTSSSDATINCKNDATNRDDNMNTNSNKPYDIRDYSAEEITAIIQGGIYMYIYVYIHVSVSLIFT